MPVLGALLLSGECSFGRSGEIETRLRSAADIKEDEMTDGSLVTGDFGELVPLCVDVRRPHDSRRAVT